MQCKKLIPVLWGMAFFLFLSCASSPPPDETPPPSVSSADEAQPAPAEEPVEVVSEPEPVPLLSSTLVETPPVLEPVVDLGEPDEASLDALNAAIVRMQTSRKLVIDFEGPESIPQAWEYAESQYAAFAELPQTTLGEVKDAVLLYNTVADAYDALARTCLPLYYKDRENEIISARTVAINTGIKEASPAHLLGADRIVAEAVAQYETADYYPAAISVFLALDMYKVLKTEADVYKIRQEIVKRGFVVYDPNNFEKAEADMAAAVKNYESRRAGQALDNAQEALGGYTTVLWTGWVSFAADKGVGASTERQTALELRADVAVRNEYDAANAVYKRADLALQSEKYDEAARLYVQSETMFLEISKAAEVKLLVAKQAVKTAEQKMLESGENAKKAELVFEGGV
ncbi:MAG: hypothetical protein LBT13_02525 [Treponema sp.]|jgi:hypothetical protein|nr:hypothetical protein [Treponema sp.]